MSKEEALEILKNKYGFTQVNGTRIEIEALDMAIKALQQQSCEDYIKILKEKYCAYRGTCEECRKAMPYYCTCEIPLHEIFDTKPVRAKGKWTEIGIWMEGRKYGKDHGEMIDAYSCDYCGYQQYRKTNFCPQCGADMRESETTE